MTSPPARRWTPDRAMPEPPAGRSGFFTMLGRGACNRCPVCAGGPVFQGFLALAPACTACGTEFAALRADDAPPYIVILLTGHLLLPVVLAVEKAWMPPIWLHMLLWLPLFTLVCTLALRPVKGAVVGWMLRLGPVGDQPASFTPRPGPGDA